MSIAYSPKAAARQFDPPLSERVIRRFIRAGAFKTIRVGQRVYLLHDDIVEALRELGATHDKG